MSNINGRTKTKKAKLTEKQRIFAEHYALTQNGAESLRVAGYGRYQILEGVLGSPVVQAYIKSLRVPMQRAMEVTLAQVDPEDTAKIMGFVEKQIILSQIARGAISENTDFGTTAKVSDRINAIKLLAQMHGELEARVQKHEMTLVWPASMAKPDVRDAGPVSFEPSQKVLDAITQDELDPDDDESGR